MVGFYDVHPTSSMIVSVTAFLIGGVYVYYGVLAWATLAIAYFLVRSKVSVLVLLHCMGLGPVSEVGYSAPCDPGCHQDEELPCTDDCPGTAALCGLADLWVGHIAVLKTCSTLTMINDM